MANIEETYYLNVVKEIINNGYESADRTGVGTKFLVSQKFDYDISNGKIPIWTTRKVPWNNQVTELLWMIRGDTNIKYLKEHNVNIWDSWADKDGYIGPTYGKQLRNWETIDKTTTVHLNNRTVYSQGNKVLNQMFFGTKSVDQFSNLINGLKTNPESRRHIISLWNSGEFSDLKPPFLPSCHSNHIQLTVINGKYLHYQMIQRSADILLGFCSWQHALFANIIGKLTGYEPKTMSIVITNCHVYNNQTTAVMELLERTPTEFPTLNVKKQLQTIQNVEESEPEDYELIGYTPQKFIKIPIAI